MISKQRKILIGGIGAMFLVAGVLLTFGEERAKVKVDLQAYSKGAVIRLAAVKDDWSPSKTANDEKGWSVHKPGEQLLELGDYYYKIVTENDQRKYGVVSVWEPGPIVIK